MKHGIFCSFLVIVFLYLYFLFWVTCHRWDYGAIILADERFSKHKQDLSVWLRPHVQVYEKFGQAIGSLMKFFKRLNGFGEDNNQNLVVTRSSKELLTTLDVQAEVEKNNLRRPSAFDKFRQINNSRKLENQPPQLPESEPPPPQPQPQQPQPQQPQPQQLRPSELFLQELRENLTDDVLLSFKSILQTYKNNLNFNVLIDEIETLLGHDMKYFPLLYNFVNFLPANNRSTFTKRLENLSQKIQKNQKNDTTQQDKKRKIELENFGEKGSFKKPRRIVVKNDTKNETEEKKIEYYPQNENIKIEDDCTAQIDK